MRSLADALRRVPTPPCEGCGLAERCATHSLACPEFAIYVRSFYSVRDVARAERPAPTSKIYESVMASDAWGAMGA